MALTYLTVVSLMLFVLPGVKLRGTFPFALAKHLLTDRHKVDPVQDCKRIGENCTASDMCCGAPRVLCVWKVREVDQTPVRGYPVCKLWYWGTKPAPVMWAEHTGTVGVNTNRNHVRTNENDKTSSNQEDDEISGDGG